MWVLGIGASGSLSIGYWIFKLVPIVNTIDWGPEALCFKDTGAYEIIEIVYWGFRVVFDGKRASDLRS